MSEKLKPCPFCGGQGDYYYIMTMRKHWIGCRNCNCATYGYDTEEEAIEAWNTRAERTCKIELCTVEEMKRRGPFTSYLSCSECQAPIQHTNYCPNCGAKVVADEDTKLHDR